MPGSSRKCKKKFLTEHRGIVHRKYYRPCFFVPKTWIGCNGGDGPVMWLFWDPLLGNEFFPVLKRPWKKALKLVEMSLKLIVGLSFFLFAWLFLVPRVLKVFKGCAILALSGFRWYLKVCYKNDELSGSMDPMKQEWEIFFEISVELGRLSYCVFVVLRDFQHQKFTLRDQLT